MQNSMMVFIASVLYWKYPFWVNLKKKIAGFSWNLVLSLTHLWRIQRWCSLVLFLIGNILFMANFFQTIKIVCWSSNLEPRLRWWLHDEISSGPAGTDFSLRLYGEAAVWRCSVKKVFLEIRQNSQENTCVRVSFLVKLQVWDNFDFLDRICVKRVFSV